jgi:hypothetical protein
VTSVHEVETWRLDLWLNWRVCSSDGGVVHPVGAPEPGRSMWIEELVVGGDAAHFFPQKLGLRNAASGSANLVSSFAPNRLLPATEELHR